MQTERMMNMTPTEMQHAEASLREVIDVLWEWEKDEQTWDQLSIIASKYGFTVRKEAPDYFVFALSKGVEETYIVMTDCDYDLTHSSGYIMCVGRAQEEKEMSSEEYLRRHKDVPGIEAYVQAVEEVRAQLKAYLKARFGS